MGWDDPNSDPLGDIRRMIESRHRPAPQPAVVTAWDIKGFSPIELAELDVGCRRMGFDGYVVAE